MTSRLAAAVFLLAAAAFGQAPSSAVPPLAEGGAVVVPSTGETVTTPFSTRTGYLYEFAVTGVYSYNGGANSADCGWWNPEGTAAWHRGGFVRVDGAAARCVDAEYSETHTYTWTQEGTGDPIAFRIDDPGGSSDNTGELVVSVVPLDSAERSVRGDCHEIAVKDTENDATAFVIMLEGEALDARVPPVGISVSCEITGPQGRVAWVTSSNVGPVAVAADVVVLPLAEYTICWVVEARWLDGSGARDEGCKPA